MRSNEPEAEDKKSRRANMAALLTPRPPYFTGREACNQAGALGSRSTSVMSLKNVHWRSSKSFRMEERKKVLIEECNVVWASQKYSEEDRRHHGREADVTYFPKISIFLAYWTLHTTSKISKKCSNLGIDHT